MCKLRSVLRAYIILSNCLSLIAGIGVIITGLIMRYGDKITQHFMEPAFDKYKASMAATSATDTGNVDIDMNVFLKSAAEGTMSVGVIMMVLSLFGILTGCYRHLRIMKVYFIGCVFLFVLEAVPLILLYTSSASVLHTIVRKELKQDLEDKYTGFFGTDAFTLLWNVVMIKGACCGVDSYMDFTSCKNWDMKETIGGVDVNLTTPISCCRDLPESFDVSCAQNADVHLNNIGNGCFDMYWQWTIGHTYFIVAVCAAIGIFQVIPGACSFGVLRLKDTARIGVLDDVRQESHPPTPPPPSAPPFPPRPRMLPPLHQPRPPILADDAVSERTEGPSTSFETNDGNNESTPRTERSSTSFETNDGNNQSAPRIERFRTSFDIRDEHNENIPRRPHSTAADGDYDSERLSYAVDAIDNVHELIRTRGLIAEVLERAQALHETLQTGSNVITVSREEEAAIHHAFTCIIHRGAVVHPMFASCCKTLIGCESCMATWYQTSPPKACPKCRHSEGKQLLKRMLGMDEAIQPLLRFVEPIGREV